MLVDPLAQKWIMTNRVAEIEHGPRVSNKAVKWAKIRLLIFKVRAAWAIKRVNEMLMSTTVFSKTTERL